MLSIDYISGAVVKLTRKYMTRNPYELCDWLNIKIHYIDLGPRVKALYNYENRMRNIVLNSRVSEIVRRLLVAHELGHDRLHKEIAMFKGFREIETFGLAIPAEHEANLFAADLLIDDDELLNLLYYDNQTFYSIARELYVPEALLDFKLRILKHKGHSIEAPYLANGDFLKNAIVGCFDEDI